VRIKIRDAPLGPYLEIDSFKVALPRDWKALQVAEFSAREAANMVQAAVLQALVTAIAEKSDRPIRRQACIVCLCASNDNICSCSCHESTFK
jgi:hypothetical protein